MIINLTEKKTHRTECWHVHFCCVSENDRFLFLTAHNLRAVRAGIAWARLFVRCILRNQ